MNYETFKKELSKQIGLNSKYFKPKELQVLMDFQETIDPSDFSPAVSKQSESSAPIN